MNELQNRPIESLFEELENITLPTIEVNELVTDLKNIVMDQLTWKSVDDKPENCKIVQARWKKDDPYYAYYDKMADEWYMRDGLIRNPTHWMEIPKLDWKENDMAYLIFKTIIEKTLKMKVSEEFRFHKVRRWRFDFAVPELMLAIEIEGGSWTQGRHTRGKGYQGDMEKYNTAQLMGWHILRYTPQQTAECMRDLESLKGGIN